MAINNVWSVSGNDYFLSEEAIEQEMLDNGIYVLGASPMGLYLRRIGNQFNFDYKIYGKDNSFIDRVIKTYSNTTGNLGMILNGIKGTGKTVTSKLLSNRFVDLNVPIILINHNFQGMPEFINKIQQDIVLVFDEFEKTFAQRAQNGSAINGNGEAGGDILTIMDGVLSGNYRRVFLMTTNNPYVNSNLLDRPSRVRYLRHYGGLDIDTIIEIVKDKLVHPKLEEETVRFISELESITIDIVKQIIEEVNIHEETPYNFKGIFNVKLLDRKKSIYKQEYDEQGKILGSKLVYNKVNVSHIRFKDEYGEDLNVIGGNFTCGRHYQYDNDLGKIVEIIDTYTVKVKQWNDETEEYDGSEVVYSMQDTINYNRTFTNYFPAAL